MRYFVLLLEPKLFFRRMKNMRQLTLFEVGNQEPNQERTAPTITKKNWILIDGNNLLNRAFYATKNNQLTAPDGTPTNAVTTALRMILNYIPIYNATPVVFFDKGKGFRKELYPAYKEGRSETPAELEPQFLILREILNTAAIPYFWDDSLEADDLIGAACNSLSGHKYIISNDKDLLQLIKPDVSVISRKEKEDVEITEEIFKELYEGLEPAQITDLKAIAGDNSDNIKGVPGVGDKGAMLLVKHYGSVECIAAVKEFPKELTRYGKKVLEAQKEMLFCKKLTTLRTDKPLSLIHYEMDKELLIKACEKYEMRSIIYYLKNGNR